MEITIEQGRQLVTLCGGPLDRRKAIVPDGCVNLHFRNIGYYEPLLDCQAFPADVWAWEPNRGV